MYYYQEEHVEGLHEWYLDETLDQYPLVLDWTKRDLIHCRLRFLVSR